MGFEILSARRTQELATRPPDRRNIPPFSAMICTLLAQFQRRMQVDLQFSFYPYQVTVQWQNPVRHGTCVQ
jgi:hypothetical protein